MTTEPVSWRGDRSPAPAFTIPAIVLLLWVLALVDTLTGWRPAMTLAAGLALLVTCWSALTRPGFSRTATLLFGGAACVLLARAGTWTDGLRAMESAARFLAFLACLYGLRSLVQTARALPQVQESFVAFRQQARRGALQLLAWVFALPLAMGAISVLVPFVAREQDPRLRADLAGWAMRGMSLTVLFSPFTIAMGVVSATLPAVNLLALIGSGFLLSLALVLSAYGLGHCRLPRHLPASFWRALRSVLAPVLLVVIANIGLILASDLTPVQSAIVVIPLFAALTGLAGRGRGTAMAKATRKALVGFDAEIAVFLSALLFAEAIRTTPEVAAFVGELAKDLGPSAMIVATLLAVGALSFFGLHMIVPTTVLLGLFGPAMPDATHLTLLGLAGLLGWAYGAMGAVGSIGFIACAKLFGVPARQLALGRNLRFSLVVGALLSAAVLTIT